MEEKIKFNPEIESEGGKLYRQYCEEKGIDYSITAGANFCLGYMAVKPNQGAAWVKASEFKTHKPVYRPYRKPAMEDEGEYDYGEIYVTEDDGRIYLDVDNECNYEHQSDERWKDYEILDESGSPAAAREEGKLTQSPADFIREANNRDLDGVGSNADDWIDVNDKLPYLDGDSSVYCIVYDVYWGVVVRPYNEAHNCWDGEDGDDYYTDAKGGKITHWKPIPESPFKQQKEK